MRNKIAGLKAALIPNKCKHRKMFEKLKKGTRIVSVRSSSFLN